MLGSILALALAAQAAPPAATAPAPPARVRQYRDVAISPTGDRLAAVEFDELFDSEAEPHSAVVVRDRATGQVLAQYDPCARCAYGGAAWSPDGTTLAFVASDRKARTASLQLVRAGRAETALSFPGLLDTPRWSPDGRTLAVLATERPRKQTGATQA